MVSLETAGPNPNILFPNFKLALLHVVQSHVTRRLVFIWEILPRFHRLVGKIAFVKPCSGSGFALFHKSVFFSGGKVEHALNVLATRFHAFEIFFGQKGDLAFGHECGRKCGIKSVIVPGRDGVKLVVVALAASERLPQEGLARNIHEVVKVHLTSLRFVNHRVVPRS